jgi:predicted nucleotide-binding protein (sugar kinase/HSP70/actin superfamily)
MEGKTAMAVKVGIPRALGYYYLYPFYKTFLEGLGAEIVVSPPTTKATLDRMESCPTDEPCIAVKLYFAHTEKLLDLGADFIFSPVLVSLEPGNFCCPKFLGISDMVRCGLGLDDDRVLCPRFDRQLRPGEADKPFHEAAAKIGISDAGLIDHAIRAAERAQRDFDRMVCDRGLTIPDAFHTLDAGHGSTDHSSLITHQESLSSKSKSCASTIGIIGHPYVLYDMLCHDMVSRLREFGDVITAEMVDREHARAALNSISDGHKMWSFDAHLLGTALHLLRNHLVDKLILVGSFECGPESIIESYVESEAEHQGVPFLLLTIDEQTGEAGLLTRLEAFMDTSSVIGDQSSVISGGKGGEMVQRSRFQVQGCRFPTPNLEPETLNQAVHQPSTINHQPFSNSMLVGIPSMGHLDIAVRAVLEDCGTKCVRTPSTTKRTVELGRELAPEFVCFPLTATLGQMREMLDNGANTIFMVSGKGRCRLGWYAQVQEQLLLRAGYDFEMISADSPFPWGEKWPHFRDSIKRIAGGKPWPRIIGAIYFGYRKLSVLDHAEQVCRRIRALERQKGTADKLFDRFVRRIERASDFRSIRRGLKEFEEAARCIEVEDTNPLRVRVVGEIWVVLEHAANQHIEKMLASREGIRVHVERELSASAWFGRNVLRDPRLIARETQAVRAAYPYLAEEVGGHGQESVGETVLAREEGCDGVVHVFPFTCMPEIVAQNILVKVSEDLDMPLLTVIVSEQSGEAGLQTRVEAFLDILEERRRFGHERSHGTRTVGNVGGNGVLG